MSNMLKYYSPVVNRNGYVLFMPNVGEESDLLQSQNPPDPYAQSSVQQYPLGTKLVQGERVWRYSKNGAGTPAAGAPLQQAAVINQAASLDVVVDAASAIGATTISITSQAAIACAKDYYKEGSIFVNVSTGIGHCYKIKTHDALVSTTAGTIVTIYDGLVVAVASSASKVGLRKNAYDMAIIAGGPLTGIPIGVAPLALTAAYYFWAQTGGPCAVLTHAAILIGQRVTVGTTSTQVDPAYATYLITEQTIGFCMAVPDTASEAMLVFLTLDS